MKTRTARPPSVKTNPPEVSVFQLADDGAIPNSRFPLLIYHAAVQLPAADPASAFEELFEFNEWGGLWRDGIYTYHHYHSTAHEVLGVYRGSATVQFGGERGIKQKVVAGDVILIPAGVAHKNMGASSDFGVVGAYPAGQEWDMNYGRPQERPQADENIARVALPTADPIYGRRGPVREHWK
ncbi:MAG TPA: cupin domain-containing protein [Verrucomicrobia bacterium]|nr:cupin domain-containing protein [Verrucomicrobiota bacterium]HOP97576.1 cupin domain-containing protein [Verrucomicrobiota bacterium]HPU56492.1 cupin domain-containing protein [Verrucomicrobiota bacterium]